MLIPASKLYLSFASRASNNSSTQLATEAALIIYLKILYHLPEKMTKNRNFEFLCLSYLELDIDATKYPRYKRLSICAAQPALYVYLFLISICIVYLILRAVNMRSHCRWFITRRN